MHSTASFGSALVFKNPLDHTIYVMSTMVYYGPKASMDLALKTSKEISLYWNGGSHGKPSARPFYATVDGERYRVIFKISTKVMSTEAAQRSLSFHYSPAVNYIEVLDGDAKAGDRSNMALSGHQGTWYLSDSLGVSTTAAHEYGHGLGLDHPHNIDWRNKGQPGIMCARGTWVAPKYQYNPSANPLANEPGSTLNPYLRKVIQSDINQLNLGKLDYNIFGFSSLGY